MDAERVRKPEYSETVICRCPADIVTALDQAAASELTSRSGYLRRAAKRQLERDGFLPAAVVSA
jgi:hypothetical protein